MTVESGVFSCRACSTILTFRRVAFMYRGLIYLFSVCSLLWFSAGRAEYVCRNMSGYLGVYECICAYSFPRRRGLALL